jgi:hypothetical protein
MAGVNAVTEQVHGYEQHKEEKKSKVLPDPIHGNTSC